MNYDTMVSIGNDLKTSFENISTMGKIILTNDDIRTYLRSDDDSVQVFQVASSIHNVTTAFNNIDSIFVFKLNGQYIDISNEITGVDANLIRNEEWKEMVFEKAGSPDFHKLLTLGLPRLVEQIDAYLNHASYQSEEWNLYKGMQISLEIFKEVIACYRDRAAYKAQEAKKVGREEAARRMQAVSGALASVLADR